MKMAVYSTPSINQNNKSIVFLLILVVFIFTLLTYINTLKNGFIWDDEYLVLENSYIKSFRYIKDIFKRNTGFSSGNLNNFYRPLQELSNMIDYFLWGRNPMGFHLTNIILHSLTSVMVFIFIFYISNNYFISFLSAILFGIHPINTESVSYIAGRADSLYSFFFLLSIIFYIKFCKRIIESKKGFGFYLVALMGFIFSLLSKEHSLILPIIILLYLYAILKGKIQDDKFMFLKLTWSGYVLIFIIYIIIRNTILDFSKFETASMYTSIPLFSRLITFFKGILVYIGLLIFPYNLHMERSIGISRSLLEPLSLIAISFIIAILFLAFKAYKENRLMTFFILWFFIMLLPVSNIVPLNSLIAEHWIYLSQIGLFAIAALHIQLIYKRLLRTKKTKTIGTGVLICLLIPYIFATIKQNAVWRDEITFFKKTLEYEPENAKLHLNLGLTYIENGMEKEALKEWEEAARLRKDYTEAYANIGTLYLGRKDFIKAGEYLTKAINIRYNYPWAHFNLGFLYYLQGNLDNAEKEFKVTLQQFPDFYKAHNLLAKVYLRENRSDLAKQYLQSSLRIYSNQPEIAALLGKIK